MKRAKFTSGKVVNQKAVERGRVTTSRGKKRLANQKRVHGYVDGKLKSQKRVRKGKISTPRGRRWAHQPAVQGYVAKRGRKKSAGTSSRRGRGGNGGPRQYVFEP